MPPSRSRNRSAGRRCRSRRPRREPRAGDAARSSPARGGHVGEPSVAANATAAARPAQRQQIEIAVAVASTSVTGAGARAAAERAGVASANDDRRGVRVVDELGLAPVEAIASA